MIKINKQKKNLRLGQSFLETLLNIKYAAQLSALGELSKSGHSVLININLHTLAGTGEYLNHKSQSAGSERRRLWELGVELELPNLGMTRMVPQAELELRFDSVPKGVDSVRLEQGREAVLAIF